MKTIVAYIIAGGILWVVWTVSSAAVHASSTIAHNIKHAADPSEKKCHDQWWTDIHNNWPPDLDAQFNRGTYCWKHGYKGYGG